MNIREVTLADAKSICTIYNYYIENTTITFETTAVSESEMQERIKKLLNENNLYYVAEIDGEIAGYCYFHDWYSRSAYASTKEISIYIDKKMQNGGIGTRLYQHLFAEISKKDNIHVLIAGICIPNEKSVHLHEKFGFKKASHLREVGWKFDAWLDVGHWVLILDGKNIKPTN